MTDRQGNGSLAYQIGLCRIALVVEQLQRKAQAHPALTEVFRSGGSHAEQSSLTYFWWVVLGGNRLRELDWKVSEVEARCVHPEILQEWLALFCQTALPIIGREFTNAWMQRAERLARTFLSADHTASLSWPKLQDVRPKKTLQIPYPHECFGAE